MPPAPAPSGDSFAVTPDGTRIAVQDRGTGRPLVLLAGQANNHHWWDGIRERFTGRRTITLDWRGVGASDKPQSDQSPELARAPDSTGEPASPYLRDGLYSTRLFAADVVAVLDRLGLERADVYGTSMGGRVAQWLAIDHPTRVDHLVLGCTSPGGSRAVHRDPAVTRSLGGPGPEALRALLELMYTPRWLAEHPGPYQVVGDDAMTPFSRRGHLRASNKHDAWSGLPGVGAPTLILHGSDDLMTPVANAELLQGLIVDAELTVLPGARHAFFHEFADVVVPRVQEFLG